jgi:hypothetical protein
MSQYVTCGWCGNVTPAVDFAKEHQDVDGEPVVVCRWCAAGEPRPSRSSLDATDSETWQALRAEPADADALA